MDIDVNLSKLKRSLKEVAKVHPELTLEESLRYIESIETQKYIDAQERKLRNLRQMMMIVANNIGVKNSDFPAFEHLVKLYYKPAKNNVFEGNFRKRKL